MKTKKSFKKAGQTEEKLIYALEGKVVVYKRPKSRTPFFYARIKLPTINRWRKFSTKTANKKEAIAKALDEYRRIELKIENNIPFDTRTFRHVADYAIKEMNEKLDAGIGRVSYRDYIRIIERYKQFFGNRYISNISYEDLVEFDKARTKKLGRKANKSTINTHNSALSYVYDLALRKNWIHQSQVLTFRNDGKSTLRRPHFEIADYRRLFRFLRTYSISTTKDSRQGGVKQKSIWMRELLRDYVLFLANTGLRPGTETRHLKWRHISEYKQDGKSYLSIRVPSGKTGPRDVIARHSTRIYLERIKSRFPELMNLSTTALSKSNDLIFRLRDGSVPKDLHGTFELALKECDLLHNSAGEKRSLYSLRHTYATFQLLRSKSPNLHAIARNMGTSIAMLERHYSHLQVFHKAAELAGDSDFPEQRELKIQSI